MENEALNGSIPTEVDGTISLDPMDFMAEEDTVEDTTEPVTEEVDTPVETEVKDEVDFTPLLERLSKDIKYMDTEVKIESIEDVIKHYQKGLDYDRKSEKIKELENSEELNYIREKAKENGMTPTEYVKAVKEWEIAQTKQQEIDEINEMVENGISKEIAQKVVESNRIAKELQAEKLKLQQEKEAMQEKAKKEAEDEEFLKAYPDVKIDSIPKEVFIEAEKVGLLTAYTKYNNQQLKLEIEKLKQANKNEKAAPIKSVAEHGGVFEKHDDFLKGLGF